MTNLTWWATLGVVVVRPVALALIVFGLGVSGPAAAWRRAPLEGESDAPVWTGWLGAGGGARQLGPATGTVRPVAELHAGVGLELSSARISRYHQLTVGPWLQATGDLAGALGEGGFELGLTKEDYDGSFYGLRAGGGYGVGRPIGAPRSSGLCFSGDVTPGGSARTCIERGAGARSRPFATGPPKGAA